MFYEEHMDNALRFGDIIKGFVLATPDIKQPFIGTINNLYKIDIEIPIYSVVLSPCCSIGDKMISLSPLINLYGTFFNNPFFVDDLTLINKKMKPEYAFPPDVWERMPGEKKQEYLAQGDEVYAFVELFIYKNHDLLPSYTINRRQGNIETNYYMIDFRNIYKLKCDRIIKPDNAPLESKCLQLTIQSRSDLRDKISAYFARIPLEDQMFDD